MSRGIRFALFTSVLWCSGLSTTASAQEPSPAAGPPGMFDNLPALTWLLVPLLVGGAAAISYWLRENDDADKPQRRQGPISRMLHRGRRPVTGRPER